MLTMDSSALADLRAFRGSFYGCLRRRGDALFELTDAILTAGAFPSPVHLSLQPSHRRGWGSLYGALRLGRLDAEALRALFARYPLDSGGEPPVYAVDVSMWPRCDAEASPDRGFYYHPSRHSAGQPIVAGWAYQWIAQLGFACESWVAPVDAARVRPTENANAVAVDQVKALLARTPERGDNSLFVFDASYDPVRLQRGLEGCDAQILVRLRAGRCFYDDPEGPPARTGRPRRHGRKLDTKDPKTWGRSPPPSTAVRTRATACWYGCAPGRGCTRRPRSTPPVGPAVRAPSSEGRSCWWKSPVCRVPPASRGCCGCGGRAWGNRTSTSSGAPTVRRFDLEHTFRFLKQELGWTTPRVRHPSRPTCGRGWWSLPSRSCAWDARAWRIGGCPESVATVLAA